MSDFRRLPDGRLIYIRGNPPKLLPGFFRDPHNPNIFIPDYIGCKHRCTKELPRFCPTSGRVRVFQIDYCNLFKKETTPTNCEDCEKAEE